jgi:hypothetical protein
MRTFQVRYGDINLVVADLTYAVFLWFSHKRGDGCHRMPVLRAPTGSRSSQNAVSCRQLRYTTVTRIPVQGTSAVVGTYRRQRVSAGLPSIHAPAFKLPEHNERTGHYFTFHKNDQCGLTWRSQPCATTSVIADKVNS